MVLWPSHGGRSGGLESRRRAEKRASRSTIKSQIFRYSGDAVARLRLAGLTLAYDMAGQGIPLVFIHQVGTDRRLWREQRALLAGHYLMITVDVLGHGELRWPLEAVSIRRAAVYVQRLVKQLLTEGAFLIGVSMGAAVAMQLALLAPSSVRGLILVSPWRRIGGYTKSLLERLFRLAEAGNMAAHTDLFFRYAFPPACLERRMPEVERLGVIALQQDSRAVSYAWAACLAADAADEAGEIGSPSLVIAGLNDLLTPPYLAQEVAKGLAAVELEVWHATGHFPLLEDPVRFNRRLKMFVRRHVTRPPPGGSGSVNSRTGKREVPDGDSDGARGFLP